MMIFAMFLIELETFKIIDDPFGKNKKVAEVFEI
jgi:hypothetical protein